MVTDRRSAPWIAGLGVLILMTGALGVALVWISAGLEVQVQEFYDSTSGGQVLDDEDYRAWDRISSNAYTLASLATPVLTGCVAAIFALLAVLARRWDVVAARDVQTEAPAAS